MTKLSYTKEEAGRFPSQPLEESPEGSGFSWGWYVLLLLAGFLVLVIVPTWVVYWIYYTPLYVLFPNSLYLPLYLKIGLNLLCGIALLWMAITLCKNRLWGGAILTGIIAMLMFLAPINEYKDIPRAIKKEYLTTECKINTLRTYRGYTHNRTGGTRRSWFRHFVISYEAERARSRSIRMDFYQYQELSKVKKEDAERVVTVYYLPNSRRMLKYE